MFPPHRREENQTGGDAAIRLTDSDAALARLSAVQKHYLADAFLKYFVHRAHLQPPRPPLINIGTYVRSEALDDLVNQWLNLSEKEGKPCQIVSLGAGSDTRFWRIATGPKKAWLRSYVEVDFAENTTKKAMAIRKSRELSAVLGKPEEVSLASGGTALHAPLYHLVPADLRQNPSEVLAPHFTAPTSSSTDEPVLSPSHPTLLLFECVLAYMEPAPASAIVQWFADYSATENGILGGIVYEMFGLQDAFGQVMLNNLQARGVTLPGAKPYPTRASLTNRFLEHGFTMAQAVTLRDIRRAYISAEEKERISRLEMLDEIEELELVLEHYAITWGVKLPLEDSVKADWLSWGLKPQQSTPTVNAD